jgi:hypothetical protein
MGRLTQRAIIPRYFASRTTTFEGYAAYSTHVFFRIAIVVRLACVPLPLSYGVPPFNGYLHDWWCYRTEFPSVYQLDGTWPAFSFRYLKIQWVSH